MKNIKTALSLALLAVAPTIYAQNIDTKAPAKPGFMVTLNVTNNGGGTDSLKIAKGKSDTLLDSLLFTGSKTNYEILYGTNARMGLQAEKGKKIKSMTVGATTVTWDATTSTTDGSKGTVSFKTGGTNYYSLPLGAINKKTDIAITWEEKASIEVKTTNTTQTEKDGNQAITEPTVTLTPANPTGLVKKYLDKDGAEISVSNITKAGTYYIKLDVPESSDYKALDMKIPLIVNNKLPLEAVDSNKPTISGTYQEGQPLSAVAIIGGDKAYKYGDREIKGTWAWADPNQLLVASSSTGSQTYNAIFTPDSSAIYNNATAEIAVDAYKVATVTVAQTTGGVVSIENASPDNRYVGTTLGSYKQIKLIATPAVGYKVVKWVTPSDDITDSEAAVSKEYTPSSATEVVSAQFVKTTRTVKKGSFSNGDIEVWNGETLLDLSTEKSVEYGTTLTIVAKPEANYEVKTVGYTYAKTKTGEGDPAVQTNSFVVGGDAGNEYTVSATFGKIPEKQKMITVTAPLNGSITMLDAGGGKVNPNSSVTAGSTVTVIAMPNKGYKLETLLAGGTDIKEAGAVTVNTDIEIKATFIEEEYKVSVTAPDQVEISGILSNDNVKFGTDYQSVTAKIKDASAGTHKLVALLINNRSVTNGTPLKIEGPTVISAQVEALTPLSILNNKITEVTYDGSVPAYAVKTAAGLGGFKVSFWQNGSEVTPTAVGTYDVHISREHDNLYADYNNTTDYKLKVNPGVPGIKKIAFSDKLAESGEATVAGTWTTTKPGDHPAITLKSLKASVTTTIYFVPDDKNIGYVTATTVTEEQAKNAKTVAITNVDHGTVSLMNGTATLAVDQAYEGLPLTVVAKADPGYQINWNYIKLGGVALSGPGYSFTVNGNITLTAESGAFYQKSEAKTPDNKVELSAFYGASIPSVPTNLLEKGANWTFRYGKQGANESDILYTTDTPKEVGKYTIYASCDEGDTYLAATKKDVGTLKIEKAKLVAANVIAKPTASPVVLNGQLSSSQLTGGEVWYNGTLVPGTFSWSEEKQVGAAGEFYVTFTPEDQNNYDATAMGIKSYVSLLGVMSYKVTIAAKNVTITDAQNKTIASGDKVPVGMKLYVVPTSGTIETLSFNVNGITYAQEGVSGIGLTWYCIVPASDFTIDATFKSGSEGDGDTPGEGTAVTGISLNKTTLTLPRLKSEKLVATVTPTGATKKDVKWTSTDPAVASVDADGTVKALKVGRTTIIATTVDGGFTAMCQVTVDFATAIEKILSESLVYSRNGQIIIEPAAPVEVSIINLGGQVIYNNSISSAVQIPANSGLYIVRMSAAGKATTTKVIVR